jgi:diamine N-acetyltransferase
MHVEFCGVSAINEIEQSNFVSEKLLMKLREINERDITNIKIWPAYPEELKDLDYALRDSGWIDAYLGKDWTRIYIAKESGVVIGFTILSKDSATCREAEFRIALNPDYLGQGFGKKLTRMALEKGFQELGLQRIYLIVRKSNPRARRLYENRGFMETGECCKEIQGIMVDLFEMALEKETFERSIEA